MEISLYSTYTIETSHNYATAFLLFGNAAFFLPQVGSVAHRLKRTKIKR